MIDDYLLKALVTFSQYGTLSETAKHLQVTQPTVTRGMQKLEDELNVSLFDRQPNRITLTETGKLAAEEAQKLLSDKQQFIENIQSFEHYTVKYRLGSVAPGPLYIAEEVVSDKVIIENDLIDIDDVIPKLISHDYQFIFTNQEIEDESIESLYIGTEHLFINCDTSLFSNNQKQTTFKELNGLSFVVLRDIGIWLNIIENNIQNAKFIYQDEVDNFNEIRRYSSLPFFTTNITHMTHSKDRFSDKQFIELPIMDETAQVDFYLSYLKENRKQLKSNIEFIQSAWHK